MRNRSENLPPDCRPIAPLLPALPDHELSPSEAARVQAHLAVCSRCREEAHAFLGLGELLRQQSVPAVELPTGAQVVARIEGVARRQAPGASNGRASGIGTPYPKLPRPASRVPPHWPLPTVFRTLAALVATACLLTWHTLSRSNASWEVVRLAGAPKVGSARINATGQLKVGQWLETDSRSKAQIEIAAIGQVQIEPNTRLRLLEARANEQRLSLARGEMHAQLIAPPRLFFVETPSAVAVDLGCHYSLAVDDAGRSLLRVGMGQVAFVLDGRESVVPAGARCETRPGIGPGTPFFDDAPAALRGALETLDFEHGGSPALSTVLATARRRDSLTLWHLLAKLSAGDWDRVYDRLASLVPPPAGVDRAGVRRRDPTILARWQVDIEDTWWG